MQIEIPNNPMGFQPPQDLDLIEVLWRQDIDLGVSRETYDINLRKELEKQREVELEKERQEQLQLEKLKQEQAEAKQLQDDIAYVLDNETGELVPVPSGADNQNQQLAMPPLEDEEGLSVEQAMQLLEQATAANDPLPTPTHVMVLPSQASQPSHTVTSDVESLEQELDALIQSTPQLPEAVSQGLLSMTTSRQNSLEQHWQDVSSLLSMDPTGVANASLNPNASDAMMMNSSSDTLSQPPANVLVHNATLGAVTPQIIIGQDLQSQMFPFTSHPSPPLVDPMTSNLTSMSPVDTGVNATSPDPLELFRNLTAQIPPAQDLMGSENLLQMLEEADMDDLDLTGLPLEDYIGAGTLEDSASDSAVSLGGSLSPSMEVDSISLHSATPYEGLEGATGGSETDSSSPKYDIKYEKYDPDYATADLGYQSPTMQMNQTLPTNASTSTPPRSQRARVRHVAHNHTYPLQPGQTPKPDKKAEKRTEGYAGETRDNKRIKSMKLPFTATDIVESSVESFNEMLQKYPLTDSQLQLVRDIRRRGKNKVAAQNCRKRKMEVIQGLEDEVEKMKAERDKLLEQKRGINKEFSTMQEKYGHLYTEVFRSLRDENGRPYDPSQFVLQQTGDGDVFLIPRTDNNRPSNDHKEKGSRKRKSKNR